MKSRYELRGRFKWLKEDEQFYVLSAHSCSCGGKKQYLRIIKVISKKREGCFTGNHTRIFMLYFINELKRLRNEEKYLFGQRLMIKKD